MRTKSGLIVREERLPERCEICHQADRFDPQTGLCTRCQNVPDLVTVPLDNLQVDWIAAGISPESLTRLQAELSEDEQVLWVGRPHLHWVDFMGSGGVMLGSLFLIWLSLSCNISLAWQAVLAMALLFFVWVGFMAFWDKFKARKAMYAVSNQRAIVMLPGQTGEISSIVGLHLTNLSARLGRDGMGDLFLTPKGSNTFFYRIQNVTSVEQLIRSNILKLEG